MDMGTDKLLDSLSTSKKVGPFVFNGVLLLVTVAFFMPGLIPGLPLDIFHGWLFMNVGAQLINQTKYRKHPTITERECPHCQTNLVYSSLRCPNKDCDFTTDIPNDKMMS